MNVKLITLLLLLVVSHANTFAGLRAAKMTAPPRRRRCNTVTSWRDAVFSAPASPRAYPRVFDAAATWVELLTR